MPVLERWMYGDPAKVAERTLDRKCDGCMHLVVLWGKPVCAKEGRQGAVLRRCKDFKRGEKCDE